VSHYNVSLAGLTEEQSEVCVVQSFSQMIIDPFVVSFRSSGRPFSSSLRRKLPHELPRSTGRTHSLWYTPLRHLIHGEPADTSFGA